MKVIPSGVALLAAPTPRAVAYASAIRGADVPLTRAFVLSPRRDTASVNALDQIRLRLAGSCESITAIEGADLNDEAVLDSLGSTRGELVIVAPPPGNILRAPLLNSGGWFLHVHPGRLPDARGSTTLHYAALLGEDATVTALLLDDGIDTGAVVHSKRLPLPRNRWQIEGGFDVTARAAVLSEVLTHLRDHGCITASPQAAGPPALHTIHPVLRAIALGAIASGPSPEGQVSA